MKKWFCLVVGMVLAVTGLAPTASASAGSLATCAGSWNVALTPGSTLAPAHIAFTTNGETGTINCVGTVNGSPVTGSGAFGKAGTLNGTCLAASGSGVASMTIPTAVGEQHVSFPFTMITSFGVGLKLSSALVGPMVFVFIPVQGNCITAPATEIAVVAQFTLKT